MQQRATNVILVSWKKQ